MVNIIIKFQDDNMKNMLEGTFDKLETHESKLKNFLNKRSKNPDAMTPTNMP